MRDEGAEEVVDDLPIGDAGEAAILALDADAAVRHHQGEELSLARREAELGQGRDALVLLRLEVFDRCGHMVFRRV